MATEYPPLGKTFVLSYANNDRDYPILAIRKDPRVDNYKIPEDLSPHPDSKRWPNHVFTGAQPTNSDERVQWVYEILPAPWVPFTRYDDDLGPIQGRRRSVKNEGQVASLAANKRVNYEAREGSAIVYTELEEAWSTDVDEDGNSIFPIKDQDIYDDRLGPIKERRQLIVPTGEEKASLEYNAPLITQITYEPYNEYLSFKIVRTYELSGPIRREDAYDPLRGPIQRISQVIYDSGNLEGSLVNQGGVITQTSYQPVNTLVVDRVIETYSVNGPVMEGRLIDNDGNLATISRRMVPAGTEADSGFKITSSAITPENKEIGVKQTVTVDEFVPLRGAQIDPRYGVVLQYSKELVDASTAVGGVSGLESVEIEPKNQWHSWKLTTRLEQLPEDQVWYGYRKESFPDVLTDLQIVGTENFQPIPSWRVAPDMPLRAKYTRKFSLGPPTEPVPQLSPRYWAEPFYIAIEYLRVSESESATTSNSTSSGTNESVNTSVSSVVSDGVQQSTNTSSSQSSSTSVTSQQSTGSGTSTNSSTSNGVSENNSRSNSFSISNSESYGTSNSDTTSNSSSQNTTVSSSINSAITNSTGIGNSRSISTSSGYSNSSGFSTSNNTSDGSASSESNSSSSSKTTTTSKNKGTSKSISRTESTSDVTSEFDSENESTNESENTQEGTSSSTSSGSSRNTSTGNFSNSNTSNNQSSGTSTGTSFGQGQTFNRSSAIGNNNGSGLSSDSTITSDGGGSSRNSTYTNYGTNESFQETNGLNSQVGENTSNTNNTSSTSSSSSGNSSSTSNSNSNSTSESTSRSTYKNDSTGKSTGKGKSVSKNTSKGDSESDSEVENDSEGDSESDGTQESRTTNDSTTTSNSTSQQTSFSASNSFNDSISDTSTTNSSTSNSITESSSESQSTGSSQTVNRSSSSSNNYNETGSEGDAFSRTQSSGTQNSSSSSTSTSSSDGTTVSDVTGTSSSQSTGETQSTNNSTASTSSSGSSTSTNASTSENTTTSKGKSIFNLTIPKCLRDTINVTLPSGEGFTIPATRQTDLNWGSYIEVARQSEHWKQGIWITEVTEVYLPEL